MRPKSKRLYRNHPQNQSCFGSQPQFFLSFIEPHPTSREVVLDLDSPFSETIGAKQGFEPKKVAKPPRFREKPKTGWEKDLQ
jgi:hypothetical protein